MVRPGKENRNKEREEMVKRAGGREAWNALTEEEKERRRKEFREGRSSGKEQLDPKIEKVEEKKKNVKERLGPKIEEGKEKRREEVQENRREKREEIKKPRIARIESLQSLGVKYEMGTIKMTEEKRKELETRPMTEEEMKEEEEKARWLEKALKIIKRKIPRERKVLEKEYREVWQSYGFWVREARFYELRIKKGKEEPERERNLRERAVFWREEMRKKKEKIWYQICSIIEKEGDSLKNNIYARRFQDIKEAEEGMLKRDKEIEKRKEEERIKWFQQEERERKERDKKWDNPAVEAAAIANWKKHLDEKRKKMEEQWDREQERERQKRRRQREKEEAEKQEKLRQAREWKPDDELEMEIPEEEKELERDFTLFELDQ